MHMHAARLPQVIIVYCAWMTALALVFLSVAPVRNLSLVLMGVSSSAAMGYGARRHRPSQRLVWCALAWVPAFYVTGRVVYNLLPGPVGTFKPYIWFAYAFYLAMSVLMLAGLVGLGRRREPERTSMIDLAILLLGAGLVAAVGLAVPYVLMPGLPPGQTVARALFVVRDVAILVALFHLVAAVRWTAPVALLTVGALGYVSYDALFRLARIHGAWIEGGWIDLGWMLFLTAWGVASLLPSMARVGGLGSRHTSTPLRLALVAGASLLPFALLGEAVFLAPWYMPALAASSTIMLMLVLTRMIAVTLQLRRQATGERVLREAVAQLATAADPPAVAAVLEEIVPRLASVRARLRVDVRPAAEGQRGEDERSGHRSGALAYALGTDPATRLRLYLHGDRATLAKLQPRLDVLASQASLTLDRTRLSQELIHRRSQEYFRTLAQTTAEAVLVVDDDDRISFASPSANDVLGTAALPGTWLPGLIDEADRYGAQRLLARTRDGEALRPGRPLAPSGGTGAGGPSTDEPVGAGWVNLADWTVRRPAGSHALVEVSCRQVAVEPSTHGLVVNLRDVTERRRLEHELTARTDHDALTGLLSRVSMRQRLRQAMSRADTGRFVGLLNIDLDDFKMVNDQFGFEVGDAVLRVLSQRLTEVSPAGATVARLGGDAFAVLLEDAPDPAVADRVAASVVTVLARPVPVDGQVASCSASVGVATTAEADSVRDLARYADLALHAAKSRGKGQVSHYDSTTYDEIKDRAQLRSELERAIEQRALVLDYQPIMTLDSGLTVGFEALLRWRHPTAGLLSPGSFIDIAEESGLIVPIGEWVLTTAMRQARRWQPIRPDAPLFVGVNVSAGQFRAAGFVGRVRNNLAATGLAPSALHLEITESLLLPDDEETWNDLQQLRRLGVRIDIDDFGTGYSALSYLRHVPLDVVKLDRLFVDAMTSSAQQRELVAGIVGLAQTLRLEVVAEGIETQAERDLVASAGCQYGQGFFLSRPMSAEQTVPWLLRERERRPVHLLAATAPGSR
jgi:diguanylate cyclase (GGDEF)-like protein